jgi:hypothetical protein
MEGRAVRHKFERDPPKDHPARSSLTYILGFSAKFSFQPIYTDYANWAYFDKRSHLNLLL